MKTRITFTGILEFDQVTDDPEEAIDMALTYGDKHQNYDLYHTGTPIVERVRDDA
jgi:hypothetical protein